MQCFSCAQMIAHCGKLAANTTMTAPRCFASNGKPGCCNAARQPGASDLPRRIAHHSNARCHIACNNRTGPNDRAITDGHPWQQDRPATYPHIFANVHWQGPLKAAATLVKSVSMVGAIDMYRGSQHATPPDADRR